MCLCGVLAHDMTTGVKNHQLVGIANTEAILRFISSDASTTSDVQFTVQRPRSNLTRTSHVEASPSYSIWKIRPRHEH